MKPVFRAPRNFLCVLSFILIIAGFFMPSAKGEYVIHISVVNETDEFHNLIVFQQDDELGLMFDKVFPLPWRVFPLPGRAEGIERRGTAEYPFSQQIGITRDIDDSFALLNKIISFGRLFGVGARVGESLRSGWLPLGTAMAAQENDIRNTVEDRPVSPVTDDKPMDHLLRLASVILGKLTIKTEARDGDRFAYSLDEKGGQHIVKQGDKTKDKSITCRNDGESVIDVDFYKNDARVAVWPSLANGDEARFLLNRIICFSYDNDLKRDAPIRTKIEGDCVVSVELAGYSTIEAKLVYDTGSAGKKKKWIITKN